MSSPGESLKTQHALNILFTRIFPAMGFCGLVITVATNLIALLIFNKAAAHFLSSGWWSTWFPSYMVWMVFLFMALAGVIMNGPNHVPDPTLSSGTPPAGQEPRHR